MMNVNDYDSVAITPATGWFAAYDHGNLPLAVWTVRSGCDPLGWVDDLFSKNNQLMPAWKLPGFQGYVQLSTVTTVPAQPGWVAVYEDGDTSPVIAWLSEVGAPHNIDGVCTPSVAMRGLCPAPGNVEDYSSTVDDYANVKLVGYRYDPEAYAKPHMFGTTTTTSEVAA